MAQDSSKPQFWDARFREGVTPWDAGTAPSSLGRFLDEETGTLRVLIPGCGTGYEVRAFAERGHEVLAIDFSDAALEAAQRELKALGHLVRKADFFALDAGTFDLVYERAFLCALPRTLWPVWASRVRELVRPGGRLAGFFFRDANDRGPPFGIQQPELHALLDAAFVLQADQAVAPEQSIAVFAGKERWQVWKRKL